MGIYLDTDYYDEIPIDVIMHKVIVFDKFAQFKRYYDRKDTLNGFGAAYYGELSFYAPTCSFLVQSKQTFKNKQFEEIQKLQNKQKQSIKVKQQQIGKNKNVKNGKSKRKMDDIPILQRLRMGMENDSDSSTDSEMTEHGKEKKVKKRKMARKKIIEQNKINISNEGMVEMKAICNRLNIKKGPNIGSRLYHFGCHLEAYREIEGLFRKYDGNTFKSFINGRNQNYCRDIKYALYTKGQIVPLSEMKQNIYKRFNELKPFYNLNRNKNGKKNRNRMDVDK